MPDNDEVTSLGAIGGSAQNGAVAFATTHCNLTPNFRLYIRERPEMISLWHAGALAKAARREIKEGQKSEKKACQRLEFSIKTRIRDDKQKGD